MALIKINLADNLLSESARIKPQAYKVARVGGATTLVVATESKPELQAVVGLLKKAKTAAISGMSARIKAATAFTKAGQTPKGPRKTALRETYKTEKAKSSADIKQAKALIKEANAHAKKHHLGGLNLPLSASDLVLSGPGLAKALKAVRAIKLTEFGVTGKRGMFKPKFVKAEKMAGGTGSSPSDRKVKPGQKKKTVTKAQIEREKAKLFPKNKNAITGAYSPAKKKALKKQREEMLTGKKPKTVSAIVDKSFKDVFKHATTTQFSAKWARDNWNFRRVGSKIVLDNPGQLMAGSITPDMAKRNGTTVDKIEQQLRDLKIPEAKTKRVARKPKPLTQYNA
ncbi:hypothetical protein pEaSNUABM3_00194 [Erwinia phage pEa_SNUABM_3]|uniref:Uncharacterized protein n=1 Tax=Erwinia phage pEa_SNUABM_3 TaxID=2869552 RepID=A0AAE7XHF0_9CAUD|nr:hypothetical protein MPK68_gp194 [Erwinia phage pEa_SNUABM_3]QZE56391.1 hypothetical protein pEaSNUABM3_00194 [Erwinia phage pEa_SNUABM_3]